MSPATIHKFKPGKAMSWSQILDCLLPHRVDQRNRERCQIITEQGARLQATATMFSIDPGRFSGERLLNCVAKCEWLRPGIAEFYRKLVAKRLGSE